MKTNQLQVVAFHCGRLTLDRAGMLYGYPRGTNVDIPMWSAAIIGSGKNILVDTGVHDADWVRENSGPFSQRPDEEFVTVLKQATGWAPSDVDIVIHTHFHHDHVGNNRLMKNAVFFVQKREYDTAFSPPEDQRWLYEPTRFLYDQSAVEPTKWRFIEGEAEIEPGIRVFPTPGHTDGHQSVLVVTREGVLCIAGDVVNMMQNIREGYANGLSTSVADCFRSMEEIKKRADYILPGHDPDIRQFQNEAFPGTNS